MEYLDLGDLLTVAEAILGRAPEVRDYGLLEAALARPQASVFGEDAYPSLVHKAAALLISLVDNHALLDGNKRLGWIGCLVFLSMNGVELGVRPAADTALVLSIADGSLTEVDAVAAELTARIAT
ncbi:type II toxin-antitoxin system death-on-curing family toxin [Cellulomonas humilata]|uniref:Type II toxin-antitoxin system death-on-curing family toxin n=1 Tax=Cellulomonas humilata TaxID=144055 RepID=A0A7Y6A2Q4_9CELL|nr:type II toxin-antitoxin system death-on-curing family toxin [Cellulomonas humilata]